SCLDIDEQTVTEAGEPGRVEVPGAGQIRQGLDAATDEATPHVEVAAEGVQPRPTAGGLQHVLVHLRMLDVVHISLSVHSRRRLLEGRARGHRHDVEPVHETLGRAIWRVHEVVAVDRRPPCDQRQRGDDGGDVGEPDDPGRLCSGKGVPVQQRDQVDGRLASPGRNDSTYRGVEKHTLQLSRTLWHWGADVRRAIHAVANVDLVTVTPDHFDRDV